MVIVTDSDGDNDNDDDDDECFPRKMMMVHLYAFVGGSWISVNGFGGFSFKSLWETPQRFIRHSGGLRANIITFGAAMNGCHKAGEWQQVLQLFEDLQRKSLQVLFYRVLWHYQLLFFKCQ